jgi:uncharacterized protein YwgA
MIRGWFMNPYILAGILKNFYSDFSIGKFENRLKLQKIIYLMQAYGLNIGYNYSLYLYGPYSTELTRDGYALPDFSQIEKIGFSTPSDNNKFLRFIEFIGKRKDDIKWLEIVASLHLLKTQGYNDIRATNFVMSKRNNEFSSSGKIIAKILDELNNCPELKC